MPCLSVNNVTKAYTNHLAVDRVSFSVPNNNIFGLLGPNGAGKTTLIRIITQIMAPDTGNVELFGEPLRAEHTRQVGYLPEERGLYNKMRVDEHILYLAQLRGMRHRDARQAMYEWLEKFELMAWRKRPVKELSKGMQQKVQFICTVIHGPRLLILDEPFSGLDPVNVDIIREEIRGFRKKGVPVILSTHRMERVEEICDRIVLIHHGRKVLDGEVQAIKQKYKQHRYRLAFAGDTGLSDGQRYQVHDKSNDTYIIQLQEDTPPNEVLEELLRNGHTIRIFEELLPSVHEVFVRLVTGNGAEKEATTKV